MSAGPTAPGVDMISFLISMISTIVIAGAIGRKIVMSPSINGRGFEMELQ